MTLSGWEAIFFWVFSIAAIFAGLLTVMARNTIHSALFLISALVSVAALFILLHAEFIAGVQILVYVGGVMVLFLCVIFSSYRFRLDVRQFRVVCRLFLESLRVNIIDRGLLLERSREHD